MKTVLTIIAIEGTVDNSTFGDSGRKFHEVSATLEGYTDMGRLITCSIEVPFFDRAKLQVGDWYTYEKDDKHNIAITKIEEP